MSGLFGVVSQKDCVEVLFYGTDYHSHLGTQKAGLAVFNHKIQRSIHDITTSQFKSKFAEELLSFKGRLGVGVISDHDSQPIIISSSFGNFTLIMSGLLINRDKLAKELMAQGGSLSELSGGEINSVEVIGKLIAQKKDIVQGIENVFEKVKGSVSLLILTKEGIYAVRDKLGRTPLIIGKNAEDWVVASETCAFPNLGFKKEKELGPGEVVLITNKGLEEIKLSLEQEKICSFLWIYTGHPTSSYDNINVETVRERCGANLARRDKKARLKIDFATGIPDSGVAHGIGYAQELKVPYRRPLIKYSPGYGRSYTPPSQKIRDMVAKMKLIPVPEVIKGKKITICDDSIVRGTQLKNQAIQKLWQWGAKEIHVRIACPPLMFPCQYCLSTRTNKELAARRAIKKTFGKKKIPIQNFLDDKSPQYKKIVGTICEELKATSLEYESIEDMIKAIGLPRERLCLYCWTGKD